MFILNTIKIALKIMQINKLIPKYLLLNIFFKSKCNNHFLQEKEASL